MAAMEQVARRALPAGFWVAWSELSNQKDGIGRAGRWVSLCLLFVFLILAALYGKPVSTLHVLLSFRFLWLVLGAYGGLPLRAILTTIRCFRSIGLIMLMTDRQDPFYRFLSFFAILEHSKVGTLQQRPLERRQTPVTAQSDDLFAFTFLGVVPLCDAKGARRIGRRSGNSVITACLPPALWDVFCACPVRMVERNRAQPITHVAVFNQPCWKGEPRPMPKPRCIRNLFRFSRMNRIYLRSSTNAEYSSLRHCYNRGPARQFRLPLSPGGQLFTRPSPSLQDRIAKSLENNMTSILARGRESRSNVPRGLNRSQ